MLTCSKQGLPKIAMVFDEDVDIWDDNAVQFAMAFRYMPHLDTVSIQNCNTMTVDPMIAEDAAPGTASKIGLDCTIPISPKFVRSHFDRSTVFELGDPPPDVVAMSEEELTADMAAFIREAPRTWKEILQHYHGQTYRTGYGAFSNLRHQLGRCDDEPWYRYTLSDTDFAVSVQKSSSSNFDPRHRTDRPRLRNCLEARKFGIPLPADMIHVTRIGALRSSTPGGNGVSLITNGPMIGVAPVRISAGRSRPSERIAPRVVRNGLLSAMALKSTLGGHG